MSERSFDVVVYGATGFTGQLVAEYLHGERATEPKELRWAIAGRSQAKLEAVRESLGAPDLPILVADSQDGAALDALCAQTRVLLTTVGPYYAYGQEVVAACVRNGTHYCDLTGETHFVHAMDRRHQAAAKASGARIVHNAGYDSIPSDLGVWMMHEAVADAGAELESVRSYARLKGGFSGGTMDTMRKTILLAGKDKVVRKALADPYSLNPEGEPPGPRTQDFVSVSWDADVGGWIGPFVMAGTNAPVVRRSNALLGFPYGRDFRYSEVMTLGKGFGGWFRGVNVSAGLGGLMVGMSLPPTRWVLDRLLPKPGEGPDREAREAGWFKHLFVAKARKDGEPIELRGTVGGSKDPGYGATCMLIAETALGLAFDGTEQDEGGIHTPASALGTRLIERLRAAGFTFEVKDTTGA